MHATPQRSHRAGRGLFVLGLFLIANSAYLAAYGDPSLFYVANALLHLLLGAVVAALFVLFVLRHREFFSGFGGALPLVLFALAAGFGLFLFFEGMTRPHTWELFAHVGFTIAGLFFLLCRFAARRSEVASALGVRRVGAWTLAVITGSLVFYGSVAAYHHYFPDPEYIIHNPASPPLTMDDEGGGKNSLMFPSSATTANGKTIPAEFFLNSKSCQPCHPDIYRQWKSSMHHFSSFNNQWYRKAIEYMQDTVGIKPSMWCAGCHDHALAFTDMMQTHPVRQIEFTPEGQAGLGCVSCHAVVHVSSTMGNGSYVMEYPPLDRYASSKNPLIHWVANYAIELNPKPHRAAFLKPFHHERQEIPEFCSVCHKVHLDVPVNHYRWIRGFDDYDHWQASGVSGNSARSFYYPPQPLVCTDCHMPLVRSNDFGNIHGYVHSHRFAAANTAVPTSHDDWTQMQDVENFLKGAVSVDIFAIAQEPKPVAEQPMQAGILGGGPQISSMFAVGEESEQGLEASQVTTAPPAKLMAPLNRGVAYLRRGETARVEVVVRTLRVGHFFPGGTVDAFDCWVEVQARDDQGHIIFWSGEVADRGKGPVDPGAHFYRSVSLDERGHWINKRNAWAAHATVYARLIPPGAADTVHFRIKIPKDCGDKITFTAKLNYRKFDWWNTQWAFAGIRDPNQKDREVSKDYDNTRWLFDGSLANVSAREKNIPDVPIVVISEDQVTVPVEPESSRPLEQNLKLDPEDRSRWNDYGIGLLLQGDLKGAERAFKIVTQLDPKYADGWVNVARALVQEGNTQAAKQYLARAIELNPKLGGAHYFMGLALKADGNYPAAYAEFAKAAGIHPDDRVVRDEMGRILFLQRQYADAAAQFQKTLAIDPEDLEAHYNLMLCYRGLGKDGLATREQKLFLRFKADEASRAITGPYELSHPADNNESLPIHEHISIADEPAADFKFFWNYGQRWDWLPGQNAKLQVAALENCAKRKMRTRNGIYVRSNERASPVPSHVSASGAGGLR